MGDPRDHGLVGLICMNGTQINSERVRKRTLTLDPLIQTNAQINGGNSGGPMFNFDGEQLGVAALTDNSKTQGILYAISVRQVNKVLATMKDGTTQTGLSSCPI